MPRRKDIDLADMTADEELRSLRQWAEQQRLFNVSDALGRILTKIKTGQTHRPDNAAR
jgi:hypothetical protein